MTQSKKRLWHREGYCAAAILRNWICESILDSCISTSAALYFTAPFTTPLRICFWQTR